MFTRKDDSYILDESLVDSILNNITSPHYNILNLINIENCKILDIGMGNGILARVLKKGNKNFIIDGVEPNEKACEIAQPFYRNVYKGFIQDYINEIPFEEYDYIIMADLIEHLVNPLDVLQTISKLISNETKVIIDVPNVAFGAVRLALLKGNWDYVDSGLLEKTHLRFFTKKTLLQLFEKTDLHPEQIINLRHKYTKSEIPINIGEYRWGTIQEINNSPEAFNYQYLFVLQKQKITNCIEKSMGKIKKVYFWQWITKRITQWFKHLF